MEKTIRVLIMEPGKDPDEHLIKNTKEDIQAIFGGLEYEKMPVSDTVFNILIAKGAKATWPDLKYDEEHGFGDLTLTNGGKTVTLAPNVTIEEYVIYGPVVFLSFGEGEDEFFDFTFEKELFRKAASWWYSKDRLELPRKPKQNTIRVIVKNPGENPVEKVIPNELKPLQDLVGGSIEPTFVGKHLCLVNEEGKIMRLKPNIITDCDVLCGPVVFLGRDREDFADFPLSLKEFECAMPELFA